MAEVLISVIVPVYNAATFLEQCVASLLTQSMQEIEVIAVNDGSTDESAPILDRLAASDERLRVFHQPNKGVSAARNFGLSKARGQYIGFCDADDWMEADMLECLYCKIMQNNCEWAICNVVVEMKGQESKQRLQIADAIIDVVNNRSPFVQDMMRFRYDNANWNKLYAASIIHKEQLRFAEDMHIWEDLLFNLQYLNYVRRVAVIGQAFYHYRVLETSLYNTKTQHLLSQFNLLFTHYLTNDKGRSCLKSLEVFKQEMARIVYNELLSKAELQVHDNNGNFFPFWNAYTRELKRFNAEIFYYPAKAGTIIQRFKKRLLYAKHFRLFAFLTTIKVVLFHK